MKLVESRLETLRRICEHDVLKLGGDSCGLPNTGNDAGERLQHQGVRHLKNRVNRTHPEDVISFCFGAILESQVFFLYTEEHYSLMMVVKAEAASLNKHSWFLGSGCGAAVWLFYPKRKSGASGRNKPKKTLAPRLIDTSEPSLLARL
jgi:hypothetical protein